jgi:hypothetical protein
MHQAVRERLGVRLGGEPQPSAGVVDSQSVEITDVGGKERGLEKGTRSSRAESATSWWIRREDPGPTMF